MRTSSSRRTPRFIRALLIAFLTLLGFLCLRSLPGVPLTDWNTALWLIVGFVLVAVALESALRAR